MAECWKIALAVAAVTILASCGGGGTPADQEMLVDYLKEQTEATTAVLDGDVSDVAFERINEVNSDYIRYYDGEPGAGEWVYPHGEWISSQGRCYDHLSAGGASFSDAQVLCNAVLHLYGVSSDLHYWFDESNAQEDEYWAEDRPGRLDEARDAVAAAQKLL